MNRERASGVYILPKGLDVQAKFATIMRRLDDLEAKGVQEVQIVNEGVTQLCLICKSTEHGMQSYPTLPIVQNMFTEQANALKTYKQYSSNSLYSNTYNPGWRNHPNLSWRGGNNGQFQYMPSQNFQQQHQTSSSNSSLEDMMREFIQKQDKRNEDQNRINAQTSQELADIRTTLSQLAEDWKIVITLRNGKEYKGPKLLVSEDIPTRDEPTVEKNTLEILEVLKQVKINIPLLDTIKQVPAYAKFLKDLCTMKKRIKLSKKAFLTEQVSAIIENKAMVKYKDPTNRSIKVPRGVVEDVLVQVEKFYYLVDFMVLDTEPLKNCVNYVPIILRRPFLATPNALINLEMNVFNLCKQPMDDDDVENKEACLIEALVQEHIENLMEENIDEFFYTIIKEKCVQVATLLLLGWLFRLFSNCHCIRGSGENHIHMPIWNLCL
ncbi:hypothetical protein AAG906_016828 [Vitis piasezkii]